MSSSGTCRCKGQGGSPEGGASAQVGKHLMKSYAYRSIPTLDIRAIVVLYRMRIEQFASIVCVVAFSLHPYWQIVIVVSLSDELGIATWAASATYHNKDSDFPSPTVRSGQVGDIGVMRGLARQNRHSRGTADGSSCEV